jgi:ABC-type methionine transport system ATPase subunit
MVEVFKTNVKDQDVADKLIDQIHKTFIDYKANFDLQDCDNILRVKCMTGSIKSALLVYLLNEFGCNAEILQDEIKQLTGADL